MSDYLDPIRQALLLFPIVAGGALTPLSIVHYRRYGFIQKWRSFVVYSLLLYLMAAAALVILPLPEVGPDYVERYARNAQPQAHLFEFVREFTDAAAERGVSGLGGWLGMLGSREFLQPLFNLLLLLPLGFYLRYLFRLRLSVAVAILLATTLFFELTQLTGLWWLYPAPYRLFDVDDLWLNSAGGLLGFALAQRLSGALPSVEKRDVVRAERVSFLRRGIAFGVDLSVLLAIVALVMLLPTEGRVDFGVAAGVAGAVVFVLVPWFAGGRTPGGGLVRVRIAAVASERSRASLAALGMRYALLIVAPPLYVTAALAATNLLHSGGWLSIAAQLLVLAAGLLAWGLIILTRRDHRGPHELLSRTRLVALAPKQVEIRPARQAPRREVECDSVA